MAERLTPERLAAIRHIRPRLKPNGEPRAEARHLLALLAHIDAQQAVLDRLMALVYVPGRWTCPKCGYVVNKAVLSMADGEVYASKEDGGPCPNDGTPLERVTWREDAASLSRRGDSQLDERDRLRALLGEAREALEGEAICSVCRGTGQVYRHCSDPQHSDSTWDHDCDDGCDACEQCEGGYSPRVNTVLAKLAQEGDRG